uniref:Uncharacterized protein n=1 Tax=viral metagenome TaxID=1070528 RepID=A0A6C0BLF2_9ZZZZ
MSNYHQAFTIPINLENQTFVAHPFVPNRTQPQLMTQARCFDLVTGACSCHVSPQDVVLQKKL